jgi:cell division protein ZapA
VSGKGDHLLELEILGQSYQVRVQGTEEWARQVAALVDGTMREIQRETRLMDTTKIAILAALNLADRLLTLRESERNLAEAAREATMDVNRILSEALR